MGTSPSQHFCGTPGKVWELGGGVSGVLGGADQYLGRERKREGVEA